ncbi:MAG TPA: hypothetical protein VF746_02280 [Longimicrobium sp.]|jgi:hypothetical protein
MRDADQAVPVVARIVLPGHRDAEGKAEVVPVPFWSRAVRTAALAGAWAAAAVTMFFVTIFDPFLTSIPVLVGAFTVYRSWRGQYLVRSFQGGCPRCGTSIRLKPGARISVPHPMVCYSCHHEPELSF